MCDIFIWKWCSSLSNKMCTSNANYLPETILESAFLWIHLLLNKFVLFFYIYQLQSVNDFALFCNSYQQCHLIEHVKKSIANLSNHIYSNSFPIFNICSTIYPTETFNKDSFTPEWSLLVITTLKISACLTLLLLD